MKKNSPSRAVLLLATAVVISLTCNVFLAMRLGNRQPDPAASLASAPSAVPAKVAPPADRPKPLEWSQIESDDFNTYIQNLRKVGCPEITIQRLVSSELDVLYPEAVATAHPMPSSDMPSKSPTSSARLSHGAAQAQKQRVMASLFPVQNKPETNQTGMTETGAPSVSPQGGEGSTPILAPVFSAGAVLAQTRPAEVPLALKESSTAALASSGGGAQVVAGIRDEFVNNIGGPEQNASDPAYINRWRTAQRRADEQLRAQIGKEAFNRLSSAAAQEAYAKAHPEIRQ
jgi:hypothetical protein